MKRFINLFLILFLLFVTNRALLGQNQTGFVLAGTLGMVDSSSVTMVADSGFVPGPAYRFFLRTTSNNSNPSAISAGVWSKTFNPTRNMPVKVLMWYKIPLWINGVLRAVTTLDDGVDANQSVSTFSSFSPGDEGVKEFPLTNNGLSIFNRLGFFLSYNQGGTGDRVLIINRIAVVSSVGDTTIIDNGTGISGVTIPTKPTLASPTNGSTGVVTNPILTWNSVTGATSYLLEVFVTSTNISVISQTVTDTTHQLSGLANNTEYSWRVRAINSAGNGDWSDVWSFTTTSGVVVPSKVMLVSPTNGLMDVVTNPTLAWSSSNGATSYQYQVFVTATNISIFDQTITDTSYQLSGLTNNTEYSWRVRAINSAGNGDWSDVWSFTTTSGVTIPTKPTLVFPSNNSHGISLIPSLGWLASQNTSSYEVQVATQSSFTNIVFSRTGVADTYVDIPFGVLKNGITYYWRVRAVNSAGSSDWSDVWNFLTLLITDVETETGIPTEFSISQNYPNPFNPSTVINFGIPKQSNVLIRIYDIAGKEVKTLVNEYLPAGKYKATFDASKLASGIYVYRIIAGKFIRTKKMILMK